MPIEYVESTQAIRVDLSLLTWGDMVQLMNIKRSSTATDEDVMLFMSGLVGRVTSQDAMSLPPDAVMEIIKEIGKRLNGNGGASAKN
jgi:hypothetical protein